MRARAQSTRAARRRAGLRLTALLLLLLLLPVAAHAYAGPGAGFSVLSSAWTLLLAFLYSFYAFMTWPFRQAIKLFRGRKAYKNARFRRVVIMGFDGMDPELAERFMREGRLPNLAKLRERGCFKPLRTTFPPISPVAWSTFQTGCNPGKHNIYDFLAPDRASYLPFLSSAQIKGPKRRLKLGKYSIPLGRPQISGLRKAIPFWHYLGKAGIFCSVVRVPATFPPEKFAGVLLSGMCVPDLKGSQGTFCFHTTAVGEDSKYEGGVTMPFRRNGSALRSYIPGPEDPLANDPMKELKAEFTVRPDTARGDAEIQIGSERFRLKVGEYSEWVPVKFSAGLGFTARGIARFNLRQLTPEVELYVTPVNIDPQHPDLPISHPLTYAVYLAKLFGPYSTLGLAEDTWALNEHVLDDEAFLQQCYDNHADRENMFFDALEKTPKGVCACVFDATDRIQHMFWRYLDQADKPDVIGEMYRRVDELVGRAMARVDSDTLFMVISDHGFKSFARGINLNSWLWQNGYLALRPGAAESGEWFKHVDWSKTRAYTLGLNGLYLNIQGREKFGIVKPGAEADALKQELKKKLDGLRDPQSGKTGISGVFLNDAVYAGPYSVNAPDLIIGYADGFRASWDAVTGKVTSVVFDDNHKAWSGDHCIDPRLVPGVFFSSHAVAEEKFGIVDLAPTILHLFGLPRPAHMDGRVLTVNGAPKQKKTPEPALSAVAD